VPGRLEGLDEVLLMLLGPAADERLLGPADDDVQLDAFLQGDGRSPIAVTVRAYGRRLSRL